MNLRHLGAIVQMRWQMMLNRLQRSGKANQAITLFLIIIVVLGSFGSFVLAAGWGKYFLTRVEPNDMIYVWDVLVGLFLFVWSISVLIELQRSELLSLRNLLHLPISLSGAFFLNYASSLASLTVIAFLPAMLGLSLASVLQFGAKSWVTFALLMGFLFMVTSVSYQLRGWLARLMENKRRRGTVIAVTTIVFVMIFQLPTLINLANIKSRHAGPRSERDVFQERLAELERQQPADEIEASEFAAKVESILAELEQLQAAEREAESIAIRRTAMFANAVLPIGWLPYGASAAAGGAVRSPWFCFLGMSTIGLVSLTMSYRSTLRVYRGSHTKRFRPAGRTRSRDHEQHCGLEKRLLFLNDQQSVVALATFRSLLRAPEAKMAMLTPLIFACVFGSFVFTGSTAELPESLRPWLGIAAIGISLFGMAQLTLNGFGIDRQGFRAYVLMPARRSDILLGKNLGTFPITGAISALLVLIVGFAVGMQITHVVAGLLQIMIANLIYFTISNYTSIVAPVGMAVGTTKPVSIRLSVVIVQLVAMALMPITVVPATIALGTELLVGALAGLPRLPIYFLLTLVEFPLAVWFYRKVLIHQGQFLQNREQSILATVSAVDD